MESVVDFPFHVMKHADPEWGDTFEIWNVGCRFDTEVDEHGSTLGMGWFECDGIGQRILSEIKRVEMPKPMKERVVFTKQYIKPDGTKSKKTVEIKTVAAFEKMLRGFVTDLTILKDGIDICYDGKGKLI